MANLISDTYKDIYESKMNDIFDTFCRPYEFKVYQTEKETIVAFDENFDNNWRPKNYFNDENIVYTEVSEIFHVRVWYPDFPQDAPFSIEDNNKINAKTKQNYGHLKVQCNEDCWEFMKKAEKVEFMGDLWHLQSDLRKIGMFDFTKYGFILQKQL